MRTERDVLGRKSIPDQAYYGIHAMRAFENFDLSGYRLPGEFIVAFAQTKLACAMTNADLGYLDRIKSEAIISACREIVEGSHHEEIIVDPFQGGAGTSTNMNFNEVVANRAAVIMGGKPGDHSLVHPIRDVNMHQSTNDVYPTALKVAVSTMLKNLETEVSLLQERLQAKEQEFRDVLKVGRTELMDAVPMTLGMEFGAYAEAVARDRWRVFKCRERIKRVNLGGTAIGTGLGAPRDYIFKVVENLKRISGLAISRSENLVDATQNMDQFVEVSGMLKAYAVNLFKISSDLRLMAGGPETGLGEIELPPLQAGSSIMAGKINPVMPEAVSQVALRVMGNDQTIGMAAALGQLELNHLLPLLAHTILESLLLLRKITHAFAEKCVLGIKARIPKCLEHVEKSWALATVLVPFLGYDRVEKCLKTAIESGRTLRSVFIQDEGLSGNKLDEIISPRRMHKLGIEPDEFDGLVGEKP